MHDVRLERRQWHGPGDVWYGKVRMTAARANVEVKPGNTLPVATGIVLAADVTPRGKLADLRYDAAVKSAGMAGHSIDDVHLGLRINRLDMNRLNEMALAMQLRQAPGAIPATPAQQLAAAKAMLHALARQAVEQDSTLDIDDLSARYHGYTARLTSCASTAGRSPCPRAARRPRRPPRRSKRSRGIEALFLPGQQVTEGRLDMAGVQEAHDVLERGVL